MEELSDQEQLDAMRAWWAENGNYVIGGIAAGIIIIFGWNRWQSGIADTEIAASNLYEDVMYASGLGLLDNAEESAHELFNEYAESPYAAQARLAMARMYMDNSRDQDAADTLRGLIDASPDTELAMLGRLRLAKILLYQGKPEEALNLVQNRSESAFSARNSEIMGDAYFSMGSYAEAEAAYIAALNDNPAAPTVDTALIQLKVNDLPVVGEVETAVEEAGIVPATDENVDDAATTTPAAENTADESEKE